MKPALLRPPRPRGERAGPAEGGTVSRPPVGGQEDSQEDGGRRDGGRRPLVVLVHGIGARKDSWDPVGRELAGSWDVVVPALPWQAGADHGWHRRAAPGRLLDSAVRQALRGSGRGAERAVAAVVAHSLGAAAVLDLLADRALAAASPVGRCPVIAVAPLLPDPDPDPGVALDRFRAVVREGMTAVPRRRARRLPSSLLDRMARAGVEQLGPGAVDASMSVARRLHVSPLETVQSPVLLVGGSADPVAPHAGVAALARRLPRAAVGAAIGRGHHCHLERPAELAVLLEALMLAASPPAC